MSDGSRAFERSHLLGHMEEADPGNLFLDRRTDSRSVVFGQIPVRREIPGRIVRVRDVELVGTVVDRDRIEYGAQQVCAVVEIEGELDRWVSRECIEFPHMTRTVGRRDEAAVMLGDPCSFGDRRYGVWNVIEHVRGKNRVERTGSERETSSFSHDAGETRCQDRCLDHPRGRVGDNDHAERRSGVVSVFPDVSRTTADIENPADRGRYNDAS